MKRPKMACVFLAWLAAVSTAAAAPLGTSITYQGRLKNAGQPANGTFNLVFTLWDAAGAGNPPVGGLQIGGADNEPSTSVTDGLFTVQLNDVNQFGASAFNGQARWVQVSVNGTVLGPRQPLTAAPYALYAVSGPGGVGSWAVNGANINNTNAGNVGIGTASPGAKMHVVGDVWAHGILESINPADPTSVTFLGWGVDGGGTDVAVLRVGGNGPGASNGLDIRRPGDISILRILHNGAIGIGTATPTQPLHVRSSVPVINIQDSDSTASSHSGYVGFNDNANVERAWMGFGSQTDTNLSIMNKYSDGMTILGANNASRLAVMPSGRVGIGTTDPQTNLEIRSSTFPTFRVAKIHSGGFGVTASAVMELKSNFTGTDLPYGRISFLDGNDLVRGSLEYGNAGGIGVPASMRVVTEGLNRLAVTNTGNVGIGTLVPQDLLHVAGTIRADGVVQAISPDQLSTVFLGWTVDGNGNNLARIRIGGDGPGATNGLVIQRTSNIELMRVHHNGQVGIGTSSVPAGVKLAVHGKVLCEELEVQLYEDWPDYVFADDYELMPLSEVGEYVRRERHLPGIPSATEIKEKGLAIGQMQADMMRKIEELTLHMIEMDKQINTLREENAALRAQVSGLSGSN